MHHRQTKSQNRLSRNILFNIQFPVFGSITSFYLCFLPLISPPSPFSLFIPPSRNPDGDVQPWCYIADHEDGIYWRYCDIPTCQSKRMCVCALACASESCSQRPVFLCYTLADLKAQRHCSSLGRGLCQSHGVSDSYENVYRSSAEAFH